MWLDWQRILDGSNLLKEIAQAGQVAIMLCLMDVAAGMSYLHSIGLLHSDLKGANVLLKSSAVTPRDPRGFVCKVGHCPSLLPWTFRTNCLGQA